MNPDLAINTQRNAANNKHKNLRKAAILLFFVLALSLGSGRQEKLTMNAQILGTNSNFYVPAPNPGALKQIADLTSKGSFTDANLIRRMINISHAIWFTGVGTQNIDQDVNNIVQDAIAKGTIPILVPYNIPFRDCGQYSAGGVNSAQEYQAWIDQFAAGIGDQPAIIILEPDSLGTIPYYTNLAGNLEPCQPAQADASTASGERFGMLNYAVDVFKHLHNVRVYLDGTNSRWLSPGEAAYRLVEAGIFRADGFFLNVSNYQYNEQAIKFGTWVSKCIWYASSPESSGNGQYNQCASQYNPGNADDYSTWYLVDQWYAENVDRQSNFPGIKGLTHFVIDTSRNGRGRWTPPKDKYPDSQEWCNAPGRGLGNLPTVDTRNPLVDAYFWIKIPGESDGECTRGLGPAGSTKDPEWRMKDPISGDWFPKMALTLARNAYPPLP